jgi:hypothetical protein
MKTRREMRNSRKASKDYVKYKSKRKKKRPGFVWNRFRLRRQELSSKHSLIRIIIRKVARQSTSLI